MNKTLSDKLGVAGVLMEIRIAGGHYQKTNPTKAAKFFQYINNILQAFERDDAQKALTLLDEIMPEVNKAVKASHAETRLIYKDIAR